MASRSSTLTIYINIELPFWQALKIRLAGGDALVKFIEAHLLENE